MADKDKYKDMPWYEVADALPPFVGPLNLPYGSAEYIIKRLMNSCYGDGGKPIRRVKVRPKS